MVDSCFSGIDLLVFSDDSFDVARVSSSSLSPCSSCVIFSDSFDPLSSIFSAAVPVVYSDIDTPSLVFLDLLAAETLSSFNDAQDCMYEHMA